jgi:hypothetical protein
MNITYEQPTKNVGVLVRIWLRLLFWSYWIFFFAIVLGRFWMCRWWVEFQAWWWEVMGSCKVCQQSNIEKLWNGSVQRQSITYIMSLSMCVRACVCLSMTTGRSLSVTTGRREKWWEKDETTVGCVECVCLFESWNPGPESHLSRS